MRHSSLTATTVWAGASSAHPAKCPDQKPRGIQGYPEGADSVPAGFLFNGPLSTYEKLGFVRDRKIGKHRWVVAKTLNPSSVVPEHWRTPLTLVVGVIRRGSSPTRGVFDLKAP